MIHRFFKAIALPVLLLSLLPACLKQVQVTNNTFSSAKHIPEGFKKGSSFCIVSLKQDDSLFSQEVADKIAKILKNDGYLISEPAQADYCLLFNCDITSSISIVHERLYIPGKTQTTKGAINSYSSSSESIEYQETTQGPATVVLVPKEYCTYKRTISIEVYDSRLYKAYLDVSRDVTQQLKSWLSKESEKDFNNFAQAKVWQGSAVSCGHSNDLREIIDYLLASSFKYFGKSTNKNVNETHREFSMILSPSW